MLKQSSLLTISPYILALACTVALGTQSALATKLTGAPLPYEREKKEFSDSNNVVIPPSASKISAPPGLPRRRKSSKNKLKQTQPRKPSNKSSEYLEAVKKAQAQDAANAKQYIQTAIDANNSAVAFGKQNRWNRSDRRS